MSEMFCKMLSPVVKRGASLKDRAAFGRSNKDRFVDVLCPADLLLKGFFARSARASPPYLRISSTLSSFSRLQLFLSRQKIRTCWFPWAILLDERNFYHTTVEFFHRTFMGKAIKCLPLSWILPAMMLPQDKAHTVLANICLPFFSWKNSTSCEVVGVTENGESWQKHTKQKCSAFTSSRNKENDSEPYFRF